jgi:hypothetical protein
MNKKFFCLIMTIIANLNVIAMEHWIMAGDFLPLERNRVIFEDDDGYRQRMLTAIQDDKLDDVKNLVAENSDSINNYLQGWTALYEAVSRDRRNITEYFLSRENINVERGWIDGRSPLSGVKSLYLCEKLLVCGASVHKKDSSDRTACAIIACMPNCQNQDILELMLQRGADPNEEINGESLLMKIVDQWTEQKVPILLKYGARVTPAIKATACENRLSAPIVYLLEDYQHARQCSVCPKWYPKSEHKNQRIFVCFECKNKDREEKFVCSECRDENKEEKNDGNDLKKAIEANDFNAIKLALFNEVPIMDAIMELAEQKQLHPYIVMLLKKQKDASCFICFEASTNPVFCMNDHAGSFLCKACYVSQVNDKKFTCPLCRCVTPEFK